MMRFVEGWLRQYDRFWFSSCEPRYCSWMRITCGVLLLIFVWIWWLDAELWFSERGVLRAATAGEIFEGTFWSPFYLLPDRPLVAQVCLGVLGLQCALMLVGVASRFQAACIFMWLTAFQHRNPLIIDGEDTVLRLWLLFMVFMPLDHAWSLGRWWRGVVSQATPANAWGLRLVQLELTAIYFSTAWSKWQGTTWRDGSALFYVSRMDDVFGRLWLPDALFVTDWLLRLTTWSVLGLETLLPILLWWPRTRRLAVMLAIGLHLAIEYAMHLFLFEWIMIAGLISFLAVRRPAASSTGAVLRDENPTADDLRLVEARL